MNYSREEETEARKRAEWNKKIARMQKEKARALRRRILITKLGIPVIVVLIIAIVLIAVLSGSREKRKEKSDNEYREIKVIEENIDESVDDEAKSNEEDDDEESEDEVILNSAEKKEYHYDEADHMDFLAGENMQSQNAILVDIDNNLIIGQVDYKARINPASMTKVLTVLVAAENVTDITDKVKVTVEATDFAYSNDCSSVGFLVDEEVTVEDLFYGTILPSGGDAAAQLAMYVAGSQDEFVNMMNEKCEELGISSTTHFTNTVGLYNENHYSTCYDMAIIMNAALDNEFCKQVLSTKKYTTSSTTEHPDGISISNWFLRRIEDKDSGGNVMCAKTGFVVQSRNCAVSYMESNEKKNYICVTANAHSAWRCIYDHVDIYKNHAN